MKFPTVLAVAATLAGPALAQVPSIVIKVKHQE